MNILAIETSCDETAAAIVCDGTSLVVSTLASSKDILEKYGGIVPEVAARKQVEFILPVLDETMQKFSKEINAKSTEEAISNIDAIAVTVGPGLIGSLLVGVAAAKSLALAWDKPIVPVNHLVGHIYGNFVDNRDLEKIEFPALVLIVSGGHTDLVLMRTHGDLKYLGGTLDDAAGEAFDKTARLLGIAKYLGGAKLSQLAGSFQEVLSNTKQHNFHNLPRPKINDDDYDFSFSGLKTAVKRIVDSYDFDHTQLSYEFESAVVDVLVKKTIDAAKNYGVKSILLGGGVSANTKLRSQLKFEAEDLNIPVFVPPINLCTDNAIYIASAAYFNNNPRSLDEVVADPSLSIIDIA